MKACLDIFACFVKIGLVTFGGGYSIMPVLERELVNGKRWLSMDEVLEYYTIGQITPGLIALNIATFVGYRRRKTAGAVLATLGFIFPGVTLIAIAALFLRNLQDIPAVRHAFAGIRLAVGALILRTVRVFIASVIKKERGLPQNAVSVSVSVCAVCFILSLVCDANPVPLVAASGLVGFLCFRTPAPDPPVSKTPTPKTPVSEPPAPKTPVPEE
jgi:chromate transporter